MRPEKQEQRGQDLLQGKARRKPRGLNRKEEEDVQAEKTRKRKRKVPKQVPRRVHPGQGTTAFPEPSTERAEHHKSVLSKFCIT